MRAPMLFLLAAFSLSADPIRIVALAGGGQLLQEAKPLFEKKYGAGLIELQTQVTNETVAVAHAVFLAHPDPETCRQLTSGYERARRRGAAILITQHQVVPQSWNYKPDAARIRQVETYYSYGGVENAVSLLAELYVAGGGAKKLTIPPAQSTMQSGIWHPQATREFPNLKEYLEWYRPRLKPNAALVGITFYNSYMRQRDIAHIEALIVALERHGLGAVAAFGWPFHTQDPMLAIDGKSPLRAIFALNLGIIRPDDSKWLTEHGVMTFNIQTTRETPEEWYKGMRGLPIDRVAHQVNTPERTGSAMPLLIAGTVKRPDGAEATLPIPERVDMAVRRVKRWIALQDKPNAQKKIALVYYNNPPGKGNLGASYLQVVPSMATMLRRLREDNYNVGLRPPDGPQLLKILERSGRNVEKWAPGELDAMVSTGAVTLWPVEAYKRHFAKLPREFREWILKEYGPPEKCELLRIEKDGMHWFVIPGVQSGNVFLGVQPLRGTFDRITAITHDTRVPVPHAYIAAYLWWRYEFKADAIAHIGRHGTLEWLPGKQVMQSSWDHGDLLQDDVPNPYYYITDGGGEALQALRRSAAVVMSHLTPILLSSGITQEFQPLKRAMDRVFETEEKQPDLAAEYRKEMLAEIAKTKLDQQLGLAGKPWPELRDGVKHFLDEMEDGPIPAGIHELGVLPGEDVQREGLAKFIEFGLRAEEIQQVRADLRPWADAIFDGKKPELRAGLPPALKDRVQTQHAESAKWIENLRLSPKAEVDVFPRVLSGKHIPSAPIGEILRVPAGLPTGRNLYGFDPLLIPTKAAWELGRKMAADTISRYRAEHNGAYPERMAMMLWYDETESHHGAMESMAMHLMGVEPTWNTRQQVDGLKLIPDAQMKHPRVNILFNVSGIYRDGFGEKMLLLDRAVRLAASAGDNAISRQDKLVKAELIKSGIDEKKAETIAKARVFGNQPGAYAIGVDRLVEQSQNAGNSRVADLYLFNMNFPYSSETWGETTAPKALENHFKGNQVALFSRTSNLYGALDNDDMYSYAGAMSFTSQTVNGGKAPSFYLHNLRKRGGENMVDLKTFLATELNQRAWNPKWITHMKNSGYAGAREMYREVEHLYGFQATTADSMDGTFWQNTYDVYVADKHGMELDKFFDKENPYARQNVLARLLEVDRQGAYKFNDADRAKLVTEYVRSVNKSGAACSANICGNKRVQEYVASVAPLVSGLGNLELRQFGKTLATATRWNVSEFANAPKEFKEGVKEAAKPQPSAQPPQLRPAPPPPAPPVVSGNVMKEKIIKLGQQAARTVLPFAWSWIAALAAVVMAGYWWEGRRTLRGL